MYNVLLERAAERDLSRLSAQVHDRIIAAIQGLANDPRPPGCRKLVGSAQAPKLKTHVQAMKANIAAAIGLDPRKVGIKATTNEKMGLVGRDQGIAAMAVASVDLPE